MGYHAINEGSKITVYSRSICDNASIYGTLYNGEVFALIKEHDGYLGTYEIGFRNSKGEYSMGFINTGKYGNLAYSGQPTTLNNKSCYRFKLRRNLQVVKPNGDNLIAIKANDFVYCQSANTGTNNSRNMYIIGYKSANSNSITPVDGFVTLDYTSGSMFSSNFCLYKQ